MASGAFDPKKFIDRKFETEVFKELIQLKDDARILTIQDQGGMGKSQLLEKLRHLCRTGKPRVPITLIALDELPDDAPLTLVRLMVEHLTDADRQFPAFWNKFNAMLDKDLAKIRGGIAGAVTMPNPNLASAEDVNIAGVQYKIDQAVIHQSGAAAQLDAEQVKSAQKATIDAFMAEIKEYAAREGIVIILDSYERCKDPIKEWMRDPLLEQYFFDFDNRPEKLVLVVAGRSVPDFDLYWPEEDIQKVVKTIQELSIWEKEHVIECLKAYDFTSYTEQDLDFFYEMVKRKIPPSIVVQAIEAQKAARK
ncbi:MAG: hypothetical protein L0Z70_03715 [Chloroflexi bacterium]|nr:hypothetical protein [Chloroflexota bacterium]